MDPLFNLYGFKPEEIRPRGMILSYPVITSGEYAHRGSFDNLLGERYERDEGDGLPGETRHGGYGSGVHLAYFDDASCLLKTACFWRPPCEESRVV